MRAISKKVLGVYLLFLLDWYQSANTDAGSLVAPTEAKLVAQILVEDLLQTAYELGEISPGPDLCSPMLTYADRIRARRDLARS